MKNGYKESILRLLLVLFIGFTISVKAEALEQETFVWIMQTDGHQEF